jgi:nitrite reductase/ring-hydroxylating ferredoxin subunit
VARQAKALATSELAPGEMKAVNLEGLNILLANIDGVVYAASNTCTHEDADLVDGHLEGRSVVCPLHYSEFDLKTGEVGLPPADKPLPVYKAWTKDGFIYVEV